MLRRKLHFSKQNIVDKIRSVSKLRKTQDPIIITADKNITYQGLMNVMDLLNLIIVAYVQEDLQALSPMLIRIVQGYVLEHPQKI